MRTICLLAALAACGGGQSGHTTDVKPTLSFSALDNATIERLVDAAAGDDVFAAQDAVEQYSTSNDVCPAIGAIGQTITLTGGCTDAFGVMLAGAARIDNPESWPQVEYDPSQPTQYTFEQLTLTSLTSTQTFDGLLGLQNSLSTYDADLDATIAGVEVRSDLFLRCTAEGGSQLSCSLSTSGIELTGQGGALVSGTIVDSSVSASLTAQLTLDGADTLTATITQNCVAWTISDSANAKTCP
ncbi:MAG TPA: hypothetical protein VGF94_00180 [Kofleriaceae bacterium]|jgi:hypothetical protein